jgi:flagellar hook assembly protein FlgD
MQVRIRVYDVSGVLVSTVADGRRTAGRQVVYWDARTDWGETVGSGVYFLRIEGEGLLKSVKMVRIR